MINTFFYLYFLNRNVKIIVCEHLFIEVINIFLISSFNLEKTHYFFFLSKKYFLLLSNQCSVKLQ